MARLRRSVIAAALSAAMLTAACGAPPEKEMQQAQTAIDAAKAAGADRYARDEYAAAQDALRKANQAVADRDYRQALNFALDSRERAQTAAKEAADNRAVARSEADAALTDAAAALKDAEQHLKAAEAHATPRTLAAPRQQIASGTKHLQDLRAALDAGKYPAVTQEAQAMAAHFRGLARDLETPAKTPAPKPEARRGRRGR